LLHTRFKRATHYVIMTVEERKRYGKRLSVLYAKFKVREVRL